MTWPYKKYQTQIQFSCGHTNSGAVHASSREEAERLVFALKEDLCLRCDLGLVESAQDQMSNGDQS